MAGGISRLSDREVRAWVTNPARTPKKLFDGAGLFITCTAADTPVWRVKYRFGGNEKTLSLGAFPEIGLKEARAKLAAARALLQDNRDPSVERRVNRAEAATSAGNTFAECAEIWLTKRRPGWSPAHFKTTSETLGRHILKYLGPLPVAEVTPRLVASVVERLDDRIDTAQKVRQICAGVFRLAIAQGKIASSNPADAAREVITRRKLKGRQPALLTLPELGDLLRRARVANLSSAVHAAHRLCAFTAQRLGNVISAEWSEFQLEGDAPRWVIPRAKMKAQDRHFDHVVILGPVIAAELRSWRKANGGPAAGFVFPAVAGSQPFISHESVEKAYRVTLGLKGRHVPHGWRSAWSTLGREAGFEKDAVELALDHVSNSETVRAYDRGARLEARAKIASWWNEQLTQAES